MVKGYEVIRTLLTIMWPELCVAQKARMATATAIEGMLIRD